jgi:5-methylcytosine-specific restriction endonuclease McrA
MIRLRKLKASNKLYGRAITWLEEKRLEYRRAREKGEPVTSFLPLYRDDVIKAALRWETSNKCAYCESKPRDVYPGDVEHILPRSGDPERQLDYRNLTFVCWGCNNAKNATEHRDDMPLLNPYADDPGRFLFASDHLVRPDLGDAARFVRGRRTIEAIGLNRHDLLEARREIVDRCFDAIVEYRNTVEPLRTYVLHKIEDMQKADAEYSFVAKSVFEKHLSTL